MRNMCGNTYVKHLPAAQGSGTQSRPSEAINYLFFGRIFK